MSLGKSSSWLQRPAHKYIDSFVFWFAIFFDDGGRSIPAYGGYQIMFDPQYVSGSQLGKSLLSEYRDQMLRKKCLAQDEQTQEQIEQTIELVDDLEALFEQG